MEKWQILGKGQEKYKISLKHLGPESKESAQKKGKRYVKRT